MPVVFVFASYPIVRSGRRVVRLAKVLPHGVIEMCVQPRNGIFSFQRQCTRHDRLQSPGYPSFVGIHVKISDENGSLVTRGALGSQDIAGNFSAVTASAKLTGM